MFGWFGGKKKADDKAPAAPAVGSEAGGTADKPGSSSSSSGVVGSSLQSSAPSIAPDITPGISHAIAIPGAGLTAPGGTGVPVSAPIDIGGGSSKGEAGRSHSKPEASSPERGGEERGKPKVTQKRLTAAGSTAAFAHMASVDSASVFAHGQDAVVGPALPVASSADAPAKKGFNYKRRAPNAGKAPIPAKNISTLPVVLETSDHHQSERPGAGLDDAKSIASTGGQSSATRITAATTRLSVPAPSTAHPELTVKVCELMTHSHDFASEDLVLNGDAFPGWAVGDYIVIKPATVQATAAIASGNMSSSQDGQNRARTYSEDAGDSRKAVVMVVSSVQTSKGGSLHMSLSANTAEMINFKVKSMVEVRRLANLEEAEALFGLDHVEFSFRDQYCSRSGMWRFRKALNRGCLTLGQAVTGHGLRMQVKEMNGCAEGKRRQGVLSGIVTPNTTFTFRSRSSHIMLLVQMSKEMWQFDNDGELHFEKLVNRFLSTLLAKWAAIGATHAVSIILFTRSFYDMDIEQLLTASGLKAQLKEVNTAASIEEVLAVDPQISQFFQDRALCLDASGRIYEDFYYPVAEDLVVTPTLAAAATAAHATQGGNVPTGPGMAEWHRVIRALKRAFSAFPVMAGWGSHAGLDDRRTGKAEFFSTPSLAAQGNFLEAINMCLNVFERHQQDRDLYRMGQNIIAVSAGSGVFEVDAALAQVTKQRMMDNGIGCDIVSMARPPMHNVPLFVTRSRTLMDPTALLKSLPKLSAPPVSVYYSQPHWIHCSFFGHVSSAFNAIAAPAHARQFAAGTSIPMLPLSRSQHQQGSSAAAAIIATGVALGSLPQVISDTNAFFAHWDAASVRGHSFGHIDGIIRTGAGFAWSKPKQITNFPNSMQSSEDSSPCEEEAFQPYPSACIFSMYHPRLSLSGPTYPPAMLEILRKAGRANRQLETAHADGRGSLPEFGTGEETADTDEGRAGRGTAQEYRRHSGPVPTFLSPIEEAYRSTSQETPGAVSSGAYDPSETVRSVGSVPLRSKPRLKNVFYKEDEQRFSSERSLSSDAGRGIGKQLSTRSRPAPRSHSAKDLAGGGRSRNTKRQTATSLWGLQGLGYALSPLQRDQSGSKMSEAEPGMRRRAGTHGSDVSSLVNRSVRDDVVLAQRVSTVESTLHMDMMSVGSGEDLGHAQLKPVAVGGVDDLGVVVVETAVPGVAPHMLRSIPGTRHLYPWNKLLRRLSKRSLVVAANYERQAVSAPTGATDFPPRTEVPLRKLYDSYKAHDADVFRSRNAASIVVSPSLSQVAKMVPGACTQDSRGRQPIRKLPSSSQLQSASTPFATSGLQVGHHQVYARTYFQNFSAPTTHVFPKPVDAFADPLMEASAYLKAGSATSSVGRLGMKLAGSMLSTDKFASPSEELVDGITSSLTQQARQMTPLELLAALATSPLLRHLNAPHATEALSSGLVAIFPESFTSKLVGVFDKRVKPSRIFRSPVYHASPTLEAISLRTYSHTAEEAPRPRTNSGSSLRGNSRLLREMSGLTLDAESRTLSASSAKHNTVAGELTSLPPPTDSSTLLQTLRGRISRPSVESAPGMSPTFALSFDGEDVTAHGQPKTSARGRGSISGHAEASALAKIKATSLPAVSSPLRNAMTAPEDITPMPLPEAALARHAQPSQDAAGSLGPKSESLGQFPAADIMSERLVWTALAGIASAAAVLGTPGNHPNAGAPINPFQRRRGDMVLATANRRRWWHMFPSNQLAEQQFTTPSANSAEVVQLARPQQTRTKVSVGENLKSIGRSANVMAMLAAQIAGSSPIDPAIDHALATADNTVGVDPLASILESFQPNWKSLCEPAIMPLTTDYIPGAQDLQLHFTETAYSVLLPRKLVHSSVVPVPAVTARQSSDAEPTDNDDAAEPSGSVEHAHAADAQVSLRSVHDAIVEEMICQRLTQDFQVVMDGAVDDARKDSYDTDAFGASKSYCVSMGHKIHKIIYDPVNASVEVKMYTKRPAQLALNSYSKKVPALKGAISAARCSMYSAAHGIGTLSQRSASDEALVEKADVAMSPSAAESFGFFVDTATTGQALSPVVAADHGAKSIHVKKGAVLLHVAECRVLATLAKILSPAHLRDDGVFDYKYLVWCPYKGKAVTTHREFKAPAVSAMQQLAGNAPDNTLVQKAFNPSKPTAANTPYSGPPSKSGLSSIFSKGLMVHTTESQHGHSESSGRLASDVAPGSWTGTSGSLPSGGSLTNSQSWGAMRLTTPSHGSIGQLGHGAAPAVFGNRPVSIRAAPVVPPSVPRGVVAPDRLLQDDYNWNYLDCLLTGEEENMTDSIRHRRVNLLMLPAPQPAKVGVEGQLMKDVISRCAAFEKFWMQSQVHSRPTDHTATSGSRSRKRYEYEPVRVHLPIVGLDPFAFDLGSTRHRGDSVTSGVSDARTHTSTSKPHSLAGLWRVLPPAQHDDSNASHVCRVDLRNRGHNGYDWVHVQYGAIFNPLRAYPISVKWITASSTAVESFVSSLQRRAKQHGFVLVAIPEYSRQALHLRSDQTLFSLDSESQRKTEASLPPFLSAVMLPISARITHEIHHGKPDAAFGSPALSHLRSDTPLSRDEVKEGSPGLLGERPDDSESVGLTPLLKARSVSVVSVTSPFIQSSAEGVEPAKLDLTSANTQQMLLFGLSTAHTTLLQSFELALVQKFGFLPDFAAGGTGATDAPLRKWYAEQCSTAPVPLHQLQQVEGNRDRTISAASIASSIIAATSSSLAQLGPPLQTLHPSGTQPGWHRQYVHSSAAAFVRVHANGVHWIPNKLQLSRLQTSAAAALIVWATDDATDDPDDTNAAKVSLYRALKMFCDELLMAA